MAANMTDRARNLRGQFRKQKTVSKRNTAARCMKDHSYVSSTSSENTGIDANDQSWKEGRRIVEFGVLLSHLQYRYCKFCRLGPVPLTYRTVVGELQKGLGGYLYVRCENPDCEQINRVPYGSMNRVSDSRKGMPCFTANTKLGTAMIDSLGGADRVNNFLSVLNLKPISQKNLKVMERRAGDFVESVAKSSTETAAKNSFQLEMEDIGYEESAEAQKAMGEEIDDLGISLLDDASPSIQKLLHQRTVLTPESERSDLGQLKDSASILSSTLKDKPHDRKKKSKFPHYNLKCKKRLMSKFPTKTRQGMSCAVDTAWHKRGFDRLTSHTFFMSKAKYGKKVVKTVVGHRTCGTCKWWQRNRPGQKIRKHRCVHNHTGSARLMESVSGVQGIKDLKASGTPVEILEGDGDNTMISRIKQDLGITMKKRLDRNHVVKNVGKQLYALHNSKGVKLSKNVVIHLQKCFKYALSKNQNENDLAENLKAILPHQFGDHSCCSARFCGFIRNPGVKYIHRSLPYKAALKDENLRKHLQPIFNQVTARAGQYVDLGSSQQCEHANREVTLRVPKSHHYGNSEALDFRVHASAAFVNEGRSYITKVNKEAGLSPGKFTEIYAEIYAEKQGKRRLKVEQKSKLPSTKRRRMQLKQERNLTQCASQALEGDTYQSEIGLEEEVDIEKIPDPVPRGNFKPVTISSGAPSIVVFDLETTDLIRGRHMPHITQIAAVGLENDASFNTYIIPKLPITETAMKVTGIVVTAGKMTVHGKYVDAEDITSGLLKFLNWLQTYQNVILVAHNGRRFDFPVLMSTVKSLKQSEMLFQSVEGFIDSLSVFKKVFPGQTNYKQETLMSSILGQTYGAHDAKEDVLALSLLMKEAKLSKSETLSFSFPPIAVQHALQFSAEKAKNVPSLHNLIAQGILKHATAENIAGSGLNFQHLKKIFQRDGEDGLRAIFVQKNCDGQPRISAAKRILDSVIPKLVDLFEKQD